MTGRIAIFGYGPVGRATAARLFAEGREVIVAQRRAPPDLPKGAAFAPCDALDGEAVVKARARKRPVRGRDRLSLCRRRLARRLAARDGELRRRLQRRPARGWCSSTISTCTVRKPRRSSRPCSLADYWLEARRALSRNPHLDGRRRRGRGAHRRAARARLLRAGRRQVLSRRHLDRQARQRQARGVRRLRRTSCTTTPTCRTSRAPRRRSWRRQTSAFGQGLARALRADPHDPRHPARSRPRRST